MDLMSLGEKSLMNNEHVFLVVDKILLFPLAVPLPLKQPDTVARPLRQHRLMVGVPETIRAGEGRELTADVFQSLCRSLGAKIQYGPADHLRAQGFVVRLRGWMQDVLA